ncbi:uncharacterized protein LOC131664523 [Phymastichus coffea]|uniref:uncharacterized protein LOC131664523 n=1 Tax=Phymastichus coffea TaxID=108790 RepID=UPI00273A8EBE|nr:uncharacterized protein LOC131664523 [Phymastichus coffea]
MIKSILVVLAAVVAVQSSEWLDHLKKRSAHLSVPIDSNLDGEDEEKYFNRKDNWKKEILAAMNDENLHESEVDIANNVEERDFVVNRLQSIFERVVDNSKV